MMSTMETACGQEIAQAATDILTKSSVSDLRALRVDAADTQLQLTGRVRSYYHKQLAQETVRSVAGGMQVVNHVEVTT